MGGHTLAHHVLIALGLAVTLLVGFGELIKTVDRGIDSYTKIEQDKLKAQEILINKIK